MSDPKHCRDCFWNRDTGYFEPCCEAHEQAYVAYLEEQAALRKVLSEALEEPAAENTRETESEK